MKTNIHLYESLNKLSKDLLIDLILRETNAPGSLVRGPEDAYKYFTFMFDLVTDWNKEHFILLCLNTKNFIVHSEVVSIGHLNASLVHPREVFKNALTKPGTAGIIVAHNHPSGNPDPSPQDMEITKMIIDGGKFLGVPLLDHIIFTQCGRYYSFNEKGKI